jgi:flagellar biosynthesis protein
LTRNTDSPSKKSSHEMNNDPLLRSFDSSKSQKSWRDGYSSRLAVAVSYDGEEMSAPEVSFAGERELASEILKIARNYNIPVKKSSSLARKLSEVPPETPIPETLYDEVAEVFLSLTRKS